MYLDTLLIPALAYKGATTKIWELPKYISLLFQMSLCSWTSEDSDWVFFIDYSRSQILYNPLWFSKAPTLSTAQNMNMCSCLNYNLERCESLILYFFVVFARVWTIFKTDLVELKYQMMQQFFQTGSDWEK